MKNIWVPLSGQIAQQRKVDTIANNIANANTAGFKSDQIAFKEHLTSLSKQLEDIDLPKEDWAPKDFYRSQGAENAYVKTAGSYTNHSQGPLQPTKNPLDFALFGKGFFEVSTPQGIRYTRNGSFNLNQAGELVTNRGYKLLSAIEEGTEGSGDIESRVIKVPTNERISVSKEGDIFSGQGLIGKFSVVEFKDIQGIRKEGNTLFINNSNQNIKRAGVETSINQGFMEGSNVNAIKEMSELIRAHRHFDNIQKAINTYDAISGKAVNDIARF